MRAKRIFSYVFTSVLCLTVSFAAGAKEVTLQHKGLTLNANMELAAGKQAADGVVLITHGMLAHNGMEAIRYLQMLFKERGYNTLAINLSLGLDNRHDMYDCKLPHRHRNEDAPEEIAAWVSWLKGQGVARVVVLGHSRGGAQTALYAAEHDDAAVKAVVLMAPAVGENSSAAEYEKHYKKPLAPLLEQARKRVAEGKGETMMERTDFLYCPEASVTAATFVSYYGGSAGLDSPSSIPRIRKPTLVVVAGGDEVVVGLEKRMAPLADGERVRMYVVEGADHFFRDLFADDAVDVIDGFLREAGG